MSENFYLPSKLSSHLRRIDLEYERNDDRKRHAIVTSARTFVQEGTAYDNFDGGTHGHDLYFYMPLDFFREISMGEQRDIADAIRNDLNDCSARIPNECWNTVHLEIEDENDIQYRRSIAPLQKARINPENLSMWTPGSIRLFISHRDKHKKKAFLLAASLKSCGISSFVAHDTIEATKEWRREIMNGLETMEIMLVFLTDDFVESPYTNQEVGFALGRSVPIISLKLETKDPPGFISHEQAEKGRYDDPETSASKIRNLIYKILGRETEMRSVLISSFCNSPNFNGTRDRFDALRESVSKLTTLEVDELTRAFKENSQLHNAGYLQSSSRFTRYLSQETGLDYVRDGRLIRRADQQAHSTFGAASF